jgi:hypothetical protein
MPLQPRSRDARRTAALQVCRTDVPRDPTLVPDLMPHVPEGLRIAIRRPVLDGPGTPSTMSALAGVHRPEDVPVADDATSSADATSPAPNVLARLADDPQEVTEVIERPDVAPLVAVDRPDRDPGDRQTEADGRGEHLDLELEA